MLFLLASFAFILLLLGGGAVLAVRRRRSARVARERLALFHRLSRTSIVAGAGVQQGADSVLNALAVGSRSRRAGLRTTLLGPIERRYPLLDVWAALPRILLATLAGGVLFGGAVRVLALGGQWVALAGLAGAFLGFWWVLAFLSARMEVRFIKLFPEVVDQIARLAVSGVPPVEALSSIANDLAAPVGPILRRLVRGFAAGVDPDLVLQSEGQRVGLAEFTVFCVVLQIQRAGGGGVSGPFDSLAATLRERRVAALKARGASAQVRLTVLVMAALPPVVLCLQYFTNPQTVEALLHTEDGQFLLRIAVILILVGLGLCQLIASRVR